MRWRPLVCLLVASSSAVGCRSAVIHHTPTRAIWVTRFDYKTAEDIDRIVGDCASVGFNTVMFQVRGNGTAFYDSDLEPWADELGGDDPGFDPLERAVDAAHERGLSLHAWFNVVPSWRGDAPPANSEQLYNAHPEWHWYDQYGNRQPLVSNFYVSLNPALPDVRTYITDVAREIAEDYDIDGLHLDYVRFVDDLIEDGHDYPRDANTLRRYRAETGLVPDEDRERWLNWKAEQVTLLVESLRDMLDDEREGAWLSAAVGGAPEKPTDKHQRDSRGWAETRLVDAVFPMNYTADLQLFRKRTRAWQPYGDRVRVVTGLNFILDRDVDLLEDELQDALSKSPDLCVFAYSYLFGAKDGEEARKQRDRRELVRRYLLGRDPLGEAIAAP